MVNSPQLSVLVPTYNYGRYLPEMIESVLAQDFRDFELLIVDDCSSDNTAEIVRPYSVKDPRVRFSVNPSNIGMVKNWNRCLEQARGQYVKFLFGDDKLYHPQALGKLVALLEQHPAATLAASARTILDEHSRVIDVYRTLPDGVHDGSAIIAKCFMENGKNLIGEPSAVLFRKADAQRGFNPKYRQIVDVEMWFHLLEKGSLTYTREPLCAFRCHPSQQTEENTNSGVGPREHVSFFTDYAMRSRLPRQAVFPLLFHFRRWRRRKPGNINSDLLACERRLMDFLGDGWRWPYRIYCARYRITKPFCNLAHSIEKRVYVRRARVNATNPRLASAT